MFILILITIFNHHYYKYDMESTSVLENYGYSLQNIIQLEGLRGPTLSTEYQIE